MDMLLPWFVLMLPTPCRENHDVYIRPQKSGHDNPEPFLESLGGKILTYEQGVFLLIFQS
jgi:hypothetical protein